eukprot:TRINITY_DN316_c0_g1_i1.p1 TRINITY_DN316_c0_g1~~TRINITY_DN316_c0_g1_i1.p1  ORF type:complete len:614 (+),score=119.72 TRINITY_DN316_c0_g1_i1:142-1983(+)
MVHGMTMMHLLPESEAVVAAPSPPYLPARGSQLARGHQFQESAVIVLSPPECTAMHDSSKGTPPSMLWNSLPMTLASEPIGLVSSRLSELYQQLPTEFEGDRASVEQFLEGLAFAKLALGLRPASRSYRSNFTAPYRELFNQDGSLHFHIEILLASIEEHQEVWVNDTMYHLGEDTMHSARALHRSWVSVCSYLEHWTMPESCLELAPRSADEELPSMLITLDKAWADFEMRYITELIQIEHQAKHPLMQAIEAEQQMRKFEENPWRKKRALHCPEYKRRTQVLLASLAKLNSVANPHCKADLHLSMNVFHNALNILQQDEAVEQKSGNLVDLQMQQAARVICMRMSLSLEAMRGYLRWVHTCLVCVDAHLSSNVGLVAKLVDLEESWALGSRYLQNQQVFLGLCDLVGAIKHAQTIVPSLRSQCEECDVNAFLVIPRLIWLRAIADPSTQLAVLSKLLPHRFYNATDDTNQSPQDSSSKESHQDMWQCDADLSGFVQEFELVFTSLLGSCGPEPPAGTAWNFLMRRAVHGAHEVDNAIYETLAPGVAAQAKTTVDAFMNQLEAWSMELQRHKPEEWNDFVAIVMEVLSEGTSSSGGIRQGRDGTSSPECYIC